MFKKLFFLFTFIFTSICTFNLPNKSEAFTEGMAGCVGECTSCHKLTKSEAAKLLKTDLYGAKVESVELGPINGIWQINMSQNGRPVKAYMDFAKKHLIQAEFMPLTEIGKKPEMPTSVDPSIIPLEDAIVIGNKRAELKVIVFDDPDCPYCAKLHEEITEIVKTRKDIAFYIKMFPLPIHKDAYRKAKTIVCTKSLKILEKAFKKQKITDPKCDTIVLDKNIELAKELGIAGTPTLVLPDGRIYSEYMTKDRLLHLIDNPTKDNSTTETHQ